jgi:hypothetical protein
MLEKLRQIIFQGAKSVINRLPGNDLWVVYGGNYKQGEQPVGKSSGAAFRLYLHNGDGYIGMPARAGNQSVARKINKMKLGQSFKIVSERSDGGLGAILDKIEIHQDFSTHDLKSNKLRF